MALVFMLSASACGGGPASTLTAAAAPTETVASHTAEDGTTPPHVASPTELARPHITPMPDAPAGDTVVNLVADNVRWTVEDITVPADETWTLVMESRDPEFHPHNFTISAGPEFADRVYQTPQLVGPATETYEIPGLPPGTYEFFCTVFDHRANMHGTLTVE